jgi:heme/copper-type cytochrome/quinol oxidase subunit 3
MTFVMMKKIHVAKTSTLLLTMGFYIISEAILFGILFTALQLDHFGIENLSLCFGITGVIFAGTGVLGNLMSRNATASLGRFL